MIWTSTDWWSRTLLITPAWDVQVERPGGVFSFIHVLDRQGRRVAQIDTQIDDGMFAAWQAGQQFGTPLPLALPGDLDPGEYRAVLGLCTQSDGARVPLSFAPEGPLPRELAGPDTIELFRFSVDDGRPAMLAE